MEPALDRLDLQMPLPVQPSFVHPDTADDTCFQLLANPTLDIVEFGDGSGIAEPWVILDPIVYFSSIDYISPAYSLILQDADNGDSSPGQDAFAQGFFMPGDLTKVRIEYETATTITNNTDTAHGNIFTLNNDGTLNKLVFSWTISNSDNMWQGRFVETIDKTELQALQNKPLAIIFFSDTDGSSPGEWVYFDDITVEACIKSSPTSLWQSFLTQYI